MTVNPKTKKTTMMSLERDILTNIKNGDETMQAKLNAAYANGGAELAISTVQKMMNIHIDRYVLINMKGLVQLVDAVGGITVNNTLGFPISIEENEPEYKAVVEPSKQHINGDQALVYSRMRYQDPEGDYGRQKRQREVIQKVVQKVLSLNSVSHYQAILKAVSNNMQTNVELSSGSIPQLLGYQDAFKKIESKQLKGEDATLADGGSYQIVTSEWLLDKNVIQYTGPIYSPSSLQNMVINRLFFPYITSSLVLYEELYGSATPSSSQSENGTTTGAADSSAYSSNPYGTDQNGQYYGQYGQ